jgi:hypothetical protein
MRDKHTAVRREVIQSLLYVLTSSSHYAYDSDVEIDLTAVNPRDVGDCSSAPTANQASPSTSAQILVNTSHTVQ